ncbi:MAG: hypothetical protein JSU87_00200, partial [Gemmatimonadota bacterium]
MKIRPLCIAVASVAFACGSAESRKAETEPASVEASSAGQSARESAAPQLGASVRPDFQLRLDPTTRHVEAWLELDISRPDTVNLLFRVDWGGYPGLAQRLVRLEAFGPDGSLTVLPDAGHFGNG